MLQFKINRHMGRITMERRGEEMTYSMNKGLATVSAEVCA